MVDSVGGAEAEGDADGERQRADWLSASGWSAQLSPTDRL